MAVPAALAVTIPLLSTVATSVLLEFQLKCWSEVDGAAVATMVSESPSVMVNSVLSRTTDSTASVTIILQLAVLAKSLVVTVILASPGATAVMLPS